MLIDWNREGEDRPWKLGHRAETPRVWKGLLLTQMMPLCQLEKRQTFLPADKAPHQDRLLSEQSLDWVSGATSQPGALA